MCIKHALELKLLHIPRPDKQNLSINFFYSPQKKLDQKKLV